MIIEVEWDTDDDEVKKALNYLAGFKEEMTSDKKHYTGVLIREVKRLREAIADIATNMEAADASYMGGFIEDLWKVIEWLTQTNTND